MGTTAIRTRSSSRSRASTTTCPTGPACIRSRTGPGWRRTRRSSTSPARPASTRTSARPRSCSQSTRRCVTWSASATSHRRCPSSVPTHSRCSTRCSSPRPDHSGRCSRTGAACGDDRANRRSRRARSSSPGRHGPSSTSCVTWTTCTTNWTLPSARGGLAVPHFDCAVSQEHGPATLCCCQLPGADHTAWAPRPSMQESFRVVVFDNPGSVDGGPAAHTRPPLRRRRRALLTHLQIDRPRRRVLHGRLIAQHRCPPPLWSDRSSSTARGGRDPTRPLIRSRQASDARRGCSSCHARSGCGCSRLATAEHPEAFVGSSGSRPKSPSRPWTRFATRPRRFWAHRSGGRGRHRRADPDHRR